MRRGIILRSVSLLLGLAAAPGAAACAAQTPPPSAPARGAEGTRFLSLLPEVANRALEGDQRSRELAVDLESFQAGAVLFERARLSREQVAAGFGRPVRGVGKAAMLAGELPAGAVHLALDAMIDLGAWVEATATVSWAAGPDRPSGHRMVRILFARGINGYRFESVRPLLVT